MPDGSCVATNLFGSTVRTVLREEESKQKHQCLFWRFLLFFEKKVGEGRHCVCVCMCVCDTVLTTMASSSKTALLAALLAASLSLLPACLSQRTPTISYVSPPVLARVGGTVEMDCSVLYATEYPVLWVKLPGGCGGGGGDGGEEARIRDADIRSLITDECTPIPLSTGSALIVRDNRFRCVVFFCDKYFLLISCGCCTSDVKQREKKRERRSHNCY